jgi:hypothetical protein
MAAIMIACFNTLTQQQDVQITAMMDSFPKMLADLDPDRIGKIALWLHATAPLPVDPPTGNGDIQTAFDFSETKWSERGAA